MDIKNRIEELKKDTNSIILAHNYQLPEIQDIADYIGDSLDLAIKAKASQSKNIIFCGVKFMAESAKILNPEKNVIIPDINAICPMAEKVDVNLLKNIIKKNYDSKVVSYINTTADVKALSDICCTSSNGVNVIKSLKSKNIIFVPDKNLGSYLKERISDKNFIIWPGICPTHNRIHRKTIEDLKDRNKDAIILVHPECRPEVIQISDYALSTNGMVNFVKTSDNNKFIIGTEKDLCYRLKKENPDKKFIPINSAICPNMKKITIDKVLNSLITNEPKINIDFDLMNKARIPLERMMKIRRVD
jgi:quinolinate synthase